MLKRVLEFYGTVAIPLIYFLGLWLIVYGKKMYLPQDLQVIGLVAAILGIVLWILSYLHLGKSFGVLPRVQKRTTYGVYNHIKHPMYKAIMLTYFGLAMANQSYAGALFTVIILFPLLFIRARLEDKKLN